ncbi:MAG: hypothetical protein CMP48_08605 [Rickettsiales bacterium]|nr:hypothetical protein [Rickettsiales bacterium]
MKYLTALIFVWTLIPALAQTTYTYQTFDDTRIVNGHSVETNQEGVLKFIISHRFGTLNLGSYEQFGLDQASMRIGLDYGITKNLTLGLGRSTFEKTRDGYFKYKLLAQSQGDKNIPFTLTVFGSAVMKTLKRTDGIDLSFQQKLSYSTQLLIARKFGSRFSLQIMPTYLHRNLVADNEENDVLSLGVAGQYQLLKNWSISAEYYATPPSYLPDGYYQSIAVGVQIDTKGHVFQLHFGNSRGMTEKFFVAETTNTWQDGGIHFGFNITRDFKLKGRKER